MKFTEFPFSSRFIQIDRFKIHYIEEGAGKPILLIHGNPTSSYLWRNLIVSLSQKTIRRVIAIDLLGFGLSDKPNINYSVDLHYSIIKSFIEKLSLNQLIIVGHDWGGPLSVRYCIDHIENVEKIIVLDTFLWNLTWNDFPKEVKLPFKIMRSPVGYLLIQVLNGFLTKFVPENIYHKEKITKELMENYKKPFLTISSRKAIRDFPNLIPVEGRPHESYVFFSSIEENIQKITIPFKMILAKPGMGEVNMEKVENIKGLLPNFSYEYIEPSGHYIQEDQPEKLSQRMIDFIN